MSFPIDWTTAPDDDPDNPFFPDVLGWTKVIKTTPATIVSTPDAGFDFTLANGETLVPWTDPDKASANDGFNFATCITEYDFAVDGTFNTQTECLYASLWQDAGGNPFNIPLGATIRAVMVSINGVIYNIANVDNVPPGPNPYALQPFALHVDSDWQYLSDHVGDYLTLDTLPTGEKFSDGSWDGTPVVVGTNEVNFTDPSNTYPVSAGGILPFLGTETLGITLTPAQVNDENFGIGFTVIAPRIG